MDDTRRLLTLCALRVEGQGIDWNLLAREAQRQGGLDRLEAGEILEDSREARAALPLLRKGLAQHLDAARERVDRELALAARVGARLATVLDPDYPINLRLVFNLPPFLFIRGALRDEDVRAVAVVGTRTPSRKGLEEAASLARLLAEQGVTVVSGLARGIDTAAHAAALAVPGGRTIAVLGTGITRCYPPENRALAEQIAERGALVSQFWPSTPPARWTFPRRNVVMSGISQGTAVVEAGATSGAKMQARLALEHGKRVWLLRSLVTGQPWARLYVQRRGAVEVSEAADVIRQLASPDRVAHATRQREQLRLDVLDVH